MTTGQILLLGAAAGFTIFLGLPIGRLRNPAPRLRLALNAIAIGVLLFLVYDILTHAIEPIENALVSASKEGGEWFAFARLAAVFAGGLGIGLVSLAYYDRWSSGRMRAAVPTEGEGAAGDQPALAVTRTAGTRLALLIAIGIGLHNFSEGLSIGQSAASGQIELALMLIIGFGLHNATEGFGIVAPLAGDETRPSWGFLALMGLIGGGPTFVGTLVGQSFVNDLVSVAFLSLAAGSIVYVIVLLLRVAERYKNTQLLMWGMFAGFIAGLATDFVLVAAGS